MKLLLVSKLDHMARGPSAPSPNTSRSGKALGHEVAVFGEQSTDEPRVPYLAGRQEVRLRRLRRLRDEGLPRPAVPGAAARRRARRSGASSSTAAGATTRRSGSSTTSTTWRSSTATRAGSGSRGSQALSDRILQPTLTPAAHRTCSPFLFHAFDPAAVARPYDSAREAAGPGRARTAAHKPYGVTYVGHNWQRWTQIRRSWRRSSRCGQSSARSAWPAGAGTSGRIGRSSWARRAWMPIRHCSQRLGVETKWPIPFNEVVEFDGQGRFCPIFHRPLFNQLGLVTNRTFETFCADTIPLLMLPRRADRGDLRARRAAAGAGRRRGRPPEDMCAAPRVYWDAVLKTRPTWPSTTRIQQRFKELLAILES